MSREPTLRERKKFRTRSSLIQIARRRFIEDGYARTKLEDICEEAEVSIRTLLRYFASKEGLAVHAVRHGIEELRLAFEEPDRKRSSLELWQEYVEARVQWATQSEGAAELLLSFAKNPAVRSALAGTREQLEDLLARELLREASGGPDVELRMRLLAAALCGGYAAALRIWLRDGAESDLRGMSRRIQNEALERFTPKELGQNPGRRQRANPTANA